MNVVVIGSGMGGLSTAAILAKAGYRVTVLEQGAQIGGCLQCFTRRGVKFETGMHFIGSAAKGQILYDLLDYLEVRDRITLSPLDPSHYEVIAYGDSYFNYVQGGEAFLEQMTEYFPSQAGNLRRYWKTVHEVAKASSIESFGVNSVMSSSDPTLLLRSINDVMDEIITDPMLRNVLLGNMPLYAAEYNCTPFSTHAFIMDFYNKSAFRIVNGSDAISTALVATIERYGGEVITKQKVERIIVDSTHATGVYTYDGKTYSADYVISSVHPRLTLDMLGETPLIRNSYRQRIDSIRQTPGIFALYLHFKPKTTPYMNHNFYGYNTTSPWGCESYADEEWPKNYLYMHFCHQPDPQWAQAGVVLAYMNIKEVEEWSDTIIGRRGPSYEALKAQKAERLLKSLEKHFPGITQNIAYYYTSTPLTYRDYTGAVDGGVYGVAKDVSMGIGYRISHKTRIPNVFLTGQSVNSHGILGVIVSSLTACGEIISQEKLYNQITSYNHA